MRTVMYNEKWGPENKRNMLESQEVYREAKFFFSSQRIPQQLVVCLEMIAVGRTVARETHGLTTSWEYPWSLRRKKLHRVLEAQHMFFKA